MTLPASISVIVRELPIRDRAALALEVIDGFGDQVWDDDQLAKLAEERDAELESGAVVALSYAEFVAGLSRPSEVS